MDDTRDEIEAQPHSLEHTFKPFEAYKLVQILGLISSRPVPEQSQSLPICFEFALKSLTGKKDTWRAARQLSLPAIILEDNCSGSGQHYSFVSVSTVTYDSVLELFWAASLQFSTMCLRRHEKNS